MKDQLNNDIYVASPPNRIISLVPSQTELLYDLGLDEEVIGITKFCVHPQTWFKTKTRIGGTKNVNIEKIISLKPDLILANKEENTKEQIERLQKLFPVWVSDIKTIEDALNMIEEVGKLVHRISEAEKISLEILDTKSKNKIETAGKRTLYLIWYQPFMAAGEDTFIQAMMKEAGFINCVHQNRYPSLSIEEIKHLDPEVVLLSSEPYPFKQKHIDELQTILPNARIVLVDGELFSWYGSRMLHSFSYFRALNEKLS